MVVTVSTGSSAGNVRIGSAGLFVELSQAARQAKSEINKQMFFMCCEVNRIFENFSSLALKNK